MNNENTKVFCGGCESSLLNGGCSASVCPQQWVAIFGSDRHINCVSGCEFCKQHGTVIGCDDGGKWAFCETCHDGSFTDKCPLNAEPGKS